MRKLLALASLAVVGGILGFVVAGCGSEKAVSLGPAGGKTGTTAATEPTGSVPTSVSLEVWFLDGEQLVRQTRSREATRLVATAAMKALLAGPSPSELASGLATSVPAGTKLLGISIKKGVATVDLTSQYQSGGGSLSMKARLAQVVYTLTQFPTVRAVLFHLDGEPVNVFSGEGIVLDHPVGRKDYEDLLPVITVDKPAAGNGSRPGGHFGERGTSSRRTSPSRCWTRPARSSVTPSRPPPAARAAVARTRSRSPSESLTSARDNRRLRRRRRRTGHAASSVRVKVVLVP